MLSNFILWRISEGQVCSYSFHTGNNTITDSTCLFKAQVKEIAAYFALCVRNSFFLFHINNSNEDTTLQVSSFPLFFLTSYYSPAPVIFFLYLSQKIQKSDYSITLLCASSNTVFHNINLSKVHISSKIKSKFVLNWKNRRERSQLWDYKNKSDNLLEYFKLLYHAQTFFLPPKITTLFRNYSVNTWVN